MFRSSRKLEASRAYAPRNERAYVPSRRVVSIEATGNRELSRCITVDREDGLYAIEGCVLTHNTLMMSFILTQMIKRDCSVYYMSLAQFDVDLKSGFSDAKRARRLEKLLDCDFLAIDEMGKEHVKDNSYLRSRLELLLKTRFDNGDPTLIGSNLDLDSLEQHYGSSITSMFRGKFNFIPLICPDYRENATKEMKSRMGFE
jgi:hypothetical protein